MMIMMWTENNVKLSAVEKGTRGRFEATRKCLTTLTLIAQQSFVLLLPPSAAAASWRTELQTQQCGTRKKREQNSHFSLQMFAM